MQLPTSMISSSPHVAWGASFRRCLSNKEGSAPIPGAAFVHLFQEVEVVFEKKLFHQRRRKINYTETFIVIWNFTELSECPNIYQRERCIPCSWIKNISENSEKNPKHGHGYASQAK